MSRPHCHCPKQGNILTFMATSHHLKLRDVRTAYRLVGEVRELGAEPPAWRRHLLEGLSRLVGTGLAGEVPAPFGGRMPEPGDILDLGWAGGAERRCCIHYMNNLAYIDDPTIPELH
jgi:hypothetical protein